MEEYHSTWKLIYVVYDSKQIVWYLFSDSYFYDYMKSFIPQFNNKALNVNSPSSPSPI